MLKQQKNWNPNPAWYETETAKFLAPIISSIITSIVVALACMWNAGYL